MHADRIFDSVDEVVERLSPSYPVMCLWPGGIEEAGRRFLKGFPGRVLYAVKCNPHRLVLESLWKAGIQDFDTASLAEIARIREMIPSGRCYFNHPVKGRGALDSAHRVYGLSHYVVDHAGELEKLLEVVGNEVTVQVRIATPGDHALYDLSSKFGAEPEEASVLLRRAAAAGCKTAVSFHVGSQCVSSQAWRTAFERVGGVVRAAGVPIDYVNSGGGFPVAYGPGVPPLEECFSVIKESFETLFGGTQTALMCEPGRALVAESGALLIQIHLRKDDSLYVNDGIFGCMSEVRDAGLAPPIRAIGRRGALTGDKRDFRVFGPTCDSTDVLKIPFSLPSDIGEGDWIEVLKMGAYSNALSSGFNGFSTDATVCIRGGLPMEEAA